MGGGVTYHLAVQYNAVQSCSIVQVHPEEEKSYGKKKKKNLYGVGPIDNRTSTDKLHHFVKKNKLII